MVDVANMMQKRRMTSWPSKLESKKTKQIEDEILSG
jgi:hypothetical protein